MRRTILSLALSLAVLAPSMANGEALHIRGEIKAGAFAHYAPLLAKADSVTLSSLGGLVLESVGIANEVRRLGLTTRIDGECASACVMIYFAGTPHHAGGRLGMHNATDASGTRMMLAFLQSVHAPRNVIAAVRNTANDKVTWKD